MPDQKRLQLNTPLKGLRLNLSDDIDHASKEKEIVATLIRYHHNVYLRLLFTYARLEDCYLSVSDSDCVLWIGKAAFDVHSKDVESIATTFGICTRSH